MLRNILTITVRNLQRQFLYSFIHIFGLAVGLACSLVIFFYAYGEWSYDRHFAKGERIYRVGISFFGMGQFAIATELLGEHLPKQFAGIEHWTRFRRSRNEEIRIGDQTFQEQLYQADSAFFSVFNYSFIAGDKNALSQPSSVVITESMALKFFNTSDGVGKVLQIGKEREEFTVTGIVRDTEGNSHMQAGVWTSLKLEAMDKYSWGSASVYNYTLLRDGTSQQDLEDALNQLIEKTVYPAVGKSMGKNSVEEYRSDANSIRFHVTPLHDIYLKSRANFELSAGGNEMNVYIFAVIACFILVLASVNFINLSTARATRRAKEVGVRKSLGTSRGKLVIQFLIESVVLSLIALVIALGLYELFVLAFLWVTGQAMPSYLWTQPAAMLIVLAFTIITGIVSGLYPAFYLTSFQPVRVLKGTVTGTSSSGFRNALVVFQFSISITLIIATTIVVRQLSFMSERDLGFEQENVLTIDNAYQLPNRYAFRDELANESDVIAASAHGGQPGNKYMMAYVAFQLDTMEQALSVSTNFGDGQLQEVMKYKLAEGRWFNPEIASDTAAVIFNESAIRALGIANPIGKVVNKEFTIIGVVRDFHWESLRNQVGPLALRYEKDKRISSSNLTQLSLKVKPGSVERILKLCQEKWKALAPDEAMQFHFLEDNFAQMVEKEAVFGKAVGMFTILAIFISCLGLFGLSAYTAEQRTKEIGIRKALGATVANIIVMLNKQFAMLVLIAVVISVPIAYFASSQWLEQFAYRADVSLWIYALAAIIALGVSSVTVGFHSVRASKTNPAETLKWE